MSDAMYLWIYIGIGVIVMLIGARIVLADAASFNARIRSWRESDDEPLTDGEDKVLALLVGFAAGAFWPLCVPIGLVWLLMKSPLFTPRLERERLARLELKELEQRVRAAEQTIAEYDRRRRP